jgi:hypothetical protein
MAVKACLDGLRVILVHRRSGYYDTVRTLRRPEVLHRPTNLPFTARCHDLDQRSGLGFIPGLGLALQLRISVVSESMGNHDSGDHGCRALRLKRR